MLGRRTPTSCLAACLVALGAHTAWAQGPGTVRGRVTGPSGEPLAGAAVSIAGTIAGTIGGTTRGTIARADGTYSLTLPAGRYELRVRLLGYAPGVDSVAVADGAVTTRDLRVQKVSTSLETVAILGTRGEQRTVISAPVPIDVLSAADIRQTGRTETAQMLQAVAPSLNFPRTTVGDGTDHVRPATLRGLAPDQALVLVNGKRRHPSALVNLNGFVGRGSQAVDLNAIPASMIDHVEILRDGAAAQYGSDAIAGVVNIVLKSTAPGELAVVAGQNLTTYNRDATPAVAFPAQMGAVSAHDGEVLTSSLNYGLALGSRGFLQLGGEVRNRAGTNRTLADTRPQYFGGDPRNANPPATHFWQGDSYNHDTQLFANAGWTLAHGVEAYAFGGYGRRRGAAAGMWRRPNDDRTVRALYPDGFLPFIKSDIGDGSGAVGVKGTTAGWSWDLGTVYGRDSFAFGVDNSANVSLGTASKTSFDAGTLTAGQSTTTLDLFRSVRAPWHAPLRIAAGGEVRAERYTITPGDSDSYRNGKVPVFDSTGAPTTRLSPPGAQVFPGFRPTDAGGHGRSNVAGYVDLETDVTSRLLLGAAGRVEHYSDFGTTATAKATSRLAIARGVALRGALSTGFRAPSLGQEFFSSTATNFVNGEAFDIRTFPVATEAAQLLGARPLKPERSVNLSAGVALEPAHGLALTADYYHITIRDRIVLTDNFLGPLVQAVFATAKLPGVTGGRYFSNAIDTRSNGIDLVANYDVALGTSSELRLTSGYNHNDVKVTHVDRPPEALSSLQETLFGRVERTRIERGNPRDNLFVSGTWSRRALGLTARTQRYGAVSVAGAAPTNATGTLDQTFGAKWITDASASYRLLSRYTLAVGADNLFDVYPDRNLNPGNPTTTNGGISNFGIFPYNGISPFGFNGRFLYTKLSIGL